MRTIVVVLALGVLLTGCGTSTNSNTAAQHNAAGQAEAKVARKASACSMVIRALGALGQKVNLASIGNTKESLHGLAESSTGTNVYAINRLTQVLSRLERFAEKGEKANYSEIGAEIGELTEKVLAICGKKEVSKSTGGESQSTTAATPTTTAEASGRPNCREPAVETASTCELEGTTVLVAHGHGEVRLSTLAARIEGIRTTASFSSGAGTATAHGIFLVISLHVTNMSATPKAFDGTGEKQVALSVSKHYYGESFQAENEIDHQSFITNEEPIQPDESKTGDLVFDVPPSVVGEVETLPESGLFIGNFGDNEIEGTPSGTGLITTKGI
jgi:uncharacterized protein YceK